MQVSRANHDGWLRLSVALMVTAVASVGCASAPSSAPRTASAPSTLILRADVLARAKDRAVVSDPAFRQLRADAEKALAAPLVVVTDKRTLLPPSGNTHDYFSLSPYWWPDPAKSDGLPYIRRDGETNPASKRDLDQPRVAAMGFNSHTLALAYYFTGDERYARRAGTQLRAWFLDSATRMTPHLHYAQLVRGNPAERGSGIIDTRWFIEAVEASVLLEGSPGWSAADAAGLRTWMRQYLNWLSTTPNGKHEHDARNNHGSWFAAQTATYAMFAGDTARVRQIVSDARARIGSQFTPAGEQPIELERTRSFHYSAFNLEALTRVAELGRHVGVDLWRHEAPNGASLRKGMDHLARHVVNPAGWPGRQIDAIVPADIVLILRRAQVALGDRAYDSVISSIPASSSARSALLYP